MKLITITGPSGAGKDLVARYIEEFSGIKPLCSYTTRPMRKGEQNGREHYFVSECCVPREEMLAYTVYGGYEYWTTINQIEGVATYIIDEEGLLSLLKNHPEIEIKKIYLSASKDTRLARGISQERILRDLHRKLLPPETYDYLIFNEEHRSALRAIVQRMLTSKDFTSFIFLQ